MNIPELPDNIADLVLARQEQDAIFIDWISGLNEAWLDQPFTFTSGLSSLKGMTYKGTHASTLTHLFNHQTHHRGQVHAALTILGIREPHALDILIKGLMDA